MVYSMGFQSIKDNIFNVNVIRVIPPKFYGNKVVKGAIRARANQTVYNNLYEFSSN